MRKKTPQSAFTLIEMLTVVVIIGFLLGVAIPNFVGMRNRGNIAKAKSDLRMLQTAVENYYVHNRVYPTSLSKLTTATPRVISVLPKDPFSGSSALYGYEKGGTGDRYYVIYSVGIGGSGAAEITNDDNITENSPSCIYVSNAGEDEAP